MLMTPSMKLQPVRETRRRTYRNSSAASMASIASSSTRPFQSVVVPKEEQPVQIALWEGLVSCKFVASNKAHLKPVL